jgi:hypothetical protein
LVLGAFVLVLVFLVLISALAPIPKSSTARESFLTVKELMKMEN